MKWLPRLGLYVLALAAVGVDGGTVIHLYGVIQTEDIPDIQTVSVRTQAHSLRRK